MSEKEFMSQKSKNIVVNFKKYPVQNHLSIAISLIYILHQRDHCPMLTHKNSFLERKRNKLHLPGGGLLVCILAA